MGDLKSQAPLYTLWNKHVLVLFSCVENKPGEGGGGVTQYGTLDLGTHPRAKKKNDTKRGDFCHRLVGSRDFQKGGIFSQKG